jgi:hypothetical protein
MAPARFQHVAEASLPVEIALSVSRPSARMRRREDRQAQYRAASVRMSKAPHRQRVPAAVRKRPKQGARNSSRAPSIAHKKSPPGLAGNGWRILEHVLCPSLRRKGRPKAKNDESQAQEPGPKKKKAARLRRGRIGTAVCRLPQAIRATIDRPESRLGTGVFK